MPKPPGFVPVVAAADTKPAIWSYTTNKPANNWYAVEFDATNWQTGLSGFGRTRNPTAVVNTVWTADDIWLRREVKLDGSAWDELLGWMNHDDDAEVYINGVLVITAAGATPSYEDFSFNGRGRRAIKSGNNLIAIHCRNTGGEQYIDFGFVKSKTN